MGYNYIENILPKNNDKRPQIKMEAKTLTIHSTGNPDSTAQGERAWLSNSDNDRVASYHLVVGEEDVIKILPFNEVGWHAGDGRNGEGNTTSIGLEIVESGDRYKVLINAINYIADLLYEKEWNISDLKKHEDWSGKNCPRILIDPNHIKKHNGEKMDWGWFLEKISERLDNKIKSEIPEWKKKGIEYLVENDLMNDKNLWNKRINEKMEVWAITLILKRIHEDLKKGGK